MMNIAVCDDDIKFSGEMEYTLITIARQEHVESSIDVFFEGKELAEQISTGRKRYDLIFMGIELKGINGLEIARIIRNTDDTVLIIFVTGCKRYAIEAYEVHPFQFMLKPVEKALLQRYFREAYKKISSNTYYYQFKYGKDTFRLPINDIMYFTSNKRIIYICMSDGTVHKYYDKLNDIEMRMKQEKVDFWRIHQSYLVNTRYILRMCYDEIELSNRKVLFISEDRRKMISKLYGSSVGEDIKE